MSYWTHIAAVIDVDTYIESPTIQSDVEKLLKDAPKITGSEEDAAVFVNVLPGYNVSMSADCAHCKFYGGEEGAEEGHFFCSADRNKGDECLDSEYQTRVVITVIGDLRDRMRDQTKKEWLEFKKYIAKHVNDNGFYIRNCACNIQGY